MKNLLYILAIFSLLLSCKNLEKLVEKGEYDEAIILATRKLAGKKNKKTKHVKALEKAFQKITDNDMRFITSLNANENPENWSRVLSVSHKIKSRQERILAFLPLRSKDGYKANFEFVDVGKLENEALNGAAAYTYTIATDLLEQARQFKDKTLAREAFHAFEKLNSYRKHYRNSDNLIIEARERGTEFVSFRIAGTEFGGLGERFILEELSNTYIARHGSFWTRIFPAHEAPETLDRILELKLLNYDLSPERETITHHTDTKSIKVGWEYITGKDGEIKTDSLGNKLKRDVFQDVTAIVSQLFREKSAFITAELRLLDANNEHMLENAQWTIENNWSDLAVSFNGDRRALCAHDLGSLKDFPLAFPHDMDMLLDATQKLKSRFQEEIKFFII